MNSARLTNSLATARISAGIDEDGGMIEKLKEEKRKFDEGLKLEIRGMDLKYQEMYNGENDRLDNVLGQHCLTNIKARRWKKHQMNKTRLATQIIGFYTLIFIT